MSTTVSLPSPRSSSRRTQILASASALVAAASVAVTLAVAGSDGASSRSTRAPATAKPNAVTQYRNNVAAERGSSQLSGGSAAERFHHFR